MNIAACIKPKPPTLRPRPVPKLFDVDGPNPGPDSGHVTRHPNTCHNIQTQVYNLRKTEQEIAIAEESKKRIQDENITKKYITHSELKSFQRNLREKVNRKIGEYDANLEVRRKKLGEVLWKEEREFNREVIIEAQKGKELKIQEEIARVAEAKREEEEARERIAYEKRLTQYLLRCTENRPIVVKQRLQETKRVQLIQMQENESKRQSEKELDAFWYQMTMKYAEEQNKRDEQDRLKILQKTHEMKCFADLQAKQRMAEEQARQKEREADKQRLDQLRKDIAEEERIAAEKKRLKKEELLRQCNEQVSAEKAMKKRLLESEQKIQSAYDALAEQEIAREKARIAAKKSTGYQDMINYQQYLAEMKQFKQVEEAILDDTIHKELMTVQQKENEIRCDAIKKKQAMLEDVMKGRAKQIEEKKQRDEELRKQKQLEFELMTQALEKCDKFSQEYQRLKKLRAKRFADSLQEQIEYSRVLKQREEEKLQRMLAAVDVENAKYDNIVSMVVSGTIKISETHPFTQVVQNEKCPCPKPNY